MVAPLAGSVENFYPRPPRGGRLKQADASGKPTIFLPTPSARRATKTPTSSLSASAISTHALREEGDGHAGLRYAQRHPISTHALREEGDAISPRFASIG